MSLITEKGIEILYAGVETPARITSISGRATQTLLLFTKKESIRERLALLILVTWFNEQEVAIMRPLTEEFFQLINLLRARRGLKWTVLYLKKVRLCVTRFLCGEPLRILDGVGLTTSGFPRILGKWLNVDLTNKNNIRYLLTLLTVYRGTVFAPVLDTTPITKSFGGDLSNVTDREHRQVMRWLKLSKMKDEFTTYHMSTKSGPNGQAILTAMVDLLALPSTLLEDIKLLGGKLLQDNIDESLAEFHNGLNLAQIFNCVFELKGDQFRKLSFFGDKEGKTRVIAILDYWSQSALIPLHNYLNRCLRKIKQDGTYNQNSFIRVLRNCQGPFYSFDLTNATDRMPIALQQKVLERIIGRERSRAWGRILTEWEYPYRKLASGVKYACGQPMGAYLSWPTMALTYHYLVKLSDLRAGISNFQDYSLLGDDIVIANTLVAAKYKELLSILDMPISDTKTHVSNHMYEFAKRWVYNQEEVTGFSISGLIETWKKYPLLHNFLETQANHGWELSFDRHPELVRGIYKIFNRPSQGERVIKLYSVFDALTEIKRTKKFSSRLSQVMSDYFGSPELELTVSATLVEQCLKSIRVQTLNSDLETFQTGLDTYLIDIAKVYARKFPGLDTPTYRAACKKLVPIIVAANNRIDQSMEVMMVIWNPDASIDEIYALDGLSKWSISPRIFSLRAAHAHVAHVARMVKTFITEWQLVSRKNRETCSMNQERAFLIYIL
jgi:hypothetical protein